VPTLYFAEGLPYVVITTVSVMMYKSMGISNSDIALYTSWLYLPWVIKPLWSPLIDIFKTKRFWVYTMELVIGGGMAGVALTIPTSHYFQLTLAFFWLLAFSSATHDIAADGFYMLALKEYQQSFFVGIRSTFYRISMLAGQGFLVILAGYFEKILGGGQTEAGGRIVRIPVAWVFTFAVVTVLYLLFFVYHKIILPRPETDGSVRETVADSRKDEFVKSFLLFFKKEKILIVIGFLLFYRLGEAQLLKIAVLFLRDVRSAGGLGLSTLEVGFVYGTLGLFSLILGGIAGGIVIAKNGLKSWLWPMLLAINIPHLLYVYLAYTQPVQTVLIYACVSIEQFSYGFGFSAYVMYMIYISEGEYKTSHYAITTGFMALGMMLPGMFSGIIQEAVGYKSFFVWVVISMFPSFFITKHVKIGESFGRKKIKD
jgi:MFS transporter, PAT family, beta-lactamase induction signal transducer AmpG